MRNCAVFEGAKFMLYRPTCDTAAQTLRPICHGFRHEAVRPAAWHCFSCFACTVSLCRMYSGAALAVITETSITIGSSCCLCSSRGMHHAKTQHCRWRSMHGRGRTPVRFCLCFPVLRSSCVHKATWCIVARVTGLSPSRKIC